MIRTMLHRDISVVIPVYNEEQSIKPLVSELGEVLKRIKKSYEVIFVDDGSRDRSFALLREAALHDPRIRVIRFRRNAGQTAAFDAGFRAAQGDIVVTMDADLQNDPHDIPRLLGKIGSFANFIRNRLSREEIVDTGCSLKAFRRESLQRMKLFNGMHRFLPTLAKMEGFTVTQVKVNHRPRRFGRTKYNIRNRMVRAFADLLAVRWMKKRHLMYEIRETIK
jgi:dolichol-phosphate mannosyltransferase